MAAPLPRAWLERPIAHRGRHGPGLGPENSRAAFRAAVAGGYAIELDVQPSADGAPMVFHDAALDRLTGRSGAPWTLDAAAMGRLTLRDGEGAPGEDGAPMLSEALALAGATTPVFVELKGDAGPAAAALVPAVAAAVAAHPGLAAVMSFDRDLVAALASALPNHPVGLVASGSPLACQSLGATFVSHQLQTLPSAETESLRAHGTPVISWTITDPAAAERAYAVSDQITFEGFRP